MVASKSLKRSLEFAKWKSGEFKLNKLPPQGDDGKNMT